MWLFPKDKRKESLKGFVFLLLIKKIQEWTILFLENTHIKTVKQISNVTWFWLVCVSQAALPCGGPAASQFFFLAQITGRTQHMILVTSGDLYTLWIRVGLCFELLKSLSQSLSIIIVTMMVVDIFVPFCHPRLP